ncbi:AAA family ATPase [Trueperella pyogenes]|uniref:AAA family ATPase n=1 Tax=Trueperella pyogenes TaxID=1661 RepID=UPI00324D96BE
MGQPPKTGGLAANSTTTALFTQATATLETPEDWARFFTTQGWGVFPVQGNTATEYKTSKQPAKGWPWTKRLAGEDNNGFTLIEHNAAYGINLKQANLVVIDDDGNGELDKWRKNHDVEPFNTFTVKTAHGYHYYFDAGHTGYGNPSPFKKKADGTHYNIDVRGNGNDHNQGGYVIGAGSRIWGTNTTYTVTNPTPPQPLPKALADFLTGATQASRTTAPRTDLDTALGANGALYIQAGIRGALDELKALQAVPEGGEPRWDATTYHLAARLVELANHPDSPYSLAEVENMFMGDAPTCATFGVEQHAHKWADAVKNVGTRTATIPQATSEQSKTVTIGEHLAGGHTLNDLEPYEEVKPAELASRIVVESLEHVQIRQQEFLWDQILPVGGVTVFGGIGGSGKSQIVAWVSAHITNGTLPGVFEGTPRNVLYFNATDEDGLDTVIAPRLRAAGADMSRVKLGRLSVNGRLEATIPVLSFRDDVRQTVKELAPALIIFDPIVASLEGKNDDTQDVAKLVGELNQIAQEANAAVICVLHPPKGVTRIEDAFGGSNQWRNKSRAGYLIAKDKPTGQIVFQCSKTSWGAEPDCLAFHIEPAEVSSGGVTVNTSRVVFDGTTENTAESILNRSPETDDVDHMDAAAWLTDYLGAHGSVPATQVFQDGRCDGFSQDQLKRAKKKIGANTRKVGDRWVWEPKPSRTLAPLPETPPTFPHDSNEKSKGAEEREKDNIAPFRSLPLFPDIPTKNPGQNSQGSKGAQEHKGTKNHPHATPCLVHGTAVDERGICAQCMAELS